MDMKKIAQEVNEMQNFILENEVRINNLKIVVIGKCLCVLKKISDSGISLDFSHCPINVNKQYRLARIVKTNDDIFVARLINQFQYNEIVVEVTKVLEELPYDDILALTKCVCEYFLRENPPFTMREKLTSMLIEEYDNYKINMDYVGDLDLKVNGKKIHFISRTGRFFHFYDGDPYIFATKEIEIKDDDKWCEVVNEILCSFKLDRNKKD